MGTPVVGSGARLGQPMATQAASIMTIGWSRPRIAPVAGPLEAAAECCGFIVTAGCGRVSA